MLIRLGADLIDRDEALLEIERCELEASLYDFTVAAWPTIDSAPFAHGGYALQAICEHLEACCDGYIPNLLINVPPRFSKSTICGVMFPAWVWTQRANTPLAGPGAQFLHAGYAMALSLQDSVKCRTLLQSDWYQKRWGDRFQLVGDMNTKTRFQNNKNGIRNTVSVGGATTGLGGNYLIGDDLNNSAEANSEAIINSTIEWWDMAWYNRLNNSKPGHGCRIVIAQRLSELDISGHVLEKGVGDWQHLCLPMRYEPERSFHTTLVPAHLTEDNQPVKWSDPRTVPGELLWPERFDEEQVRLLEKTLGPWGAAGQLQQRPEPAGGGIIKREWWQTWIDEAFPPFHFIVASLDTAYGLKEENDYSALTVWGVFYGTSEIRSTRHVNRYGKQSVIQPGEVDDIDGLPRVMLMTAFQDRLELHNLVTKVGDTCRRLKVDRLLIENKASGISVAQEIRRIYGHEEFAVQLVDPRGQDKLARLYSVQHLFAEEMIYAPDRAWADMVITQVGQFPKGRNDDLCLVGDTLITMADGTTKRIDEIMVGDMVATPVGPCLVSAAAMTGVREVWQINFTGGTLTGTANHPVWANNQWKPLASLCPSDTLWTLYPFSGSGSWFSNLKKALLLKLLNLMGLNTVDTQIQPIRPIEDTLPEPVIDCTVTFGSFSKAQFQRVIKSITLMATPGIMTFQTLNACHSRNIAQNMPMNTAQEVNQKNDYLILHQFVKKLKNGIEVMKAALGTDKMHTHQCERKVRQNLTAKAIIPGFVSGAVRFLKQKVQKKQCVRYNALTENQNLCVVKSITPTHTMRPVYNLTVDGEHCYFANGVLTHNCDTVSMALRHMREVGLLTRSAERMAEVEDATRFKGNKPLQPLYPV